MHLIPIPRSMSSNPGSFFAGDLSTIALPAGEHRSLFIAAQDLAQELQNATSLRPRIVCGNSPLQGWAVKVEISSDIIGEQHYTLAVSDNGVLIRARREVGAFYGLQTLRQILRSNGPIWPLVVIDDQPDLPNRGFYHDITRSKVPTLATLKLLADKLAYYKINQLQLYVEHTFAFAQHSDLWSCVDPLTAEEILELDTYCRDRHIELVPSMSTFGHFYMALRSKRHEELNELEVKGGDLPFSLIDRMAHYTLDCQNPGAIELVKSMLHEYIPLFSSKYFNICCDETFDLGQGKNKELAEKVGKGKLYLEFLKKVIKIVNTAGKIPMFWGDVILQEPELIQELPSGTIVLDWDYSADVQRNNTLKFQQANVPFYVCPGVAGWQRCLPDVNVASQNITSYAKKGKELGASGVLNTDWGDHGHINLLGTSYHGLALGAAASWNVEAASHYREFDRDWEVLELGLSKPGFVELWREFCQSTVAIWSYLEVIFDPSGGLDSKLDKHYYEWYQHKLENSILVQKQLFPELTNCLSSAKPLDKLTPAEFLVGFRGTILVQEALEAIKEQLGRSPWQIADDLRHWESDLTALWLQRNKLSEYGYFRAIICQVTTQLDRMGSNLKSD